MSYGIYLIPILTYYAFLVWSKHGINELIIKNINDKKKNPIRKYFIIVIIVIKDFLYEIDRYIFMKNIEIISFLFF